jgi:kynurenine formamidase
VSRQATDRRRDGSNWQRWGADDEIGTLNLCSPAAVLEALALPTRGQVYSLAHEVGRSSPVSESKNPPWHLLTTRRAPTSGCTSADDVLVLHSHSGTHIDALGHYWHGDELYNGWSAAEITPNGANRLSIARVHGIVAPAVVLDLSSVCQGPPTPHGVEVTAEHIRRELARLNLSISPGDAFIFRTGWEATFTTDRRTYQWGEPGIGLDALTFLAECDVSLIGADNWGIEAVPPAERGEGLVVHRRALNDFGIHLLENLRLADLLHDAGPGRYLLVTAPLRVTGGVGSPVNPLIIT